MKYFRRMNINLVPVIGIVEARGMILDGKALLRG